MELREIDPDKEFDVRMRGQIQDLLPGGLKGVAHSIDAQENMGK